VRKREKAAAKKREEKGIDVLGRRAVMAQSPFESPRRGTPRRGMKPRVAGRNRWRRIEVIQRNRRWLEAYRRALQRVRDGFRETLFPAGTYELARLNLVDCHPL